VRLAGQFAPVTGALIGLLGGAVYWLAVHAWPTSVAVILAMTSTALLIEGISPLPAARYWVLWRVMLVLIKYNALMALSAAKLPFAAPADMSLVLIMISAHACSFALLVSVLAYRPQKSGPKIGSVALATALAVGFAPAALLGIPGLTGVSAAILAGIGIIAFLRFKRAEGGADALDMTQLSTEACFYLGALATWRYV
jgi:cobalamin synthase